MRQAELDAIHAYIRRQIERELEDRSWAWLAHEADVPQSTLATQVGRPRFSIAVLVQVARVFEKDLAYFLPPVDAPLDDRWSSRRRA